MSYTYLCKVLVSDELNFHTSIEVNRPTLKIWCLQSLHVIQEVKRDSPKITILKITINEICNRGRKK
jgi:hypothetical protein